MREFSSGEEGVIVEELSSLAQEILSNASWITRLGAVSNAFKEEPKEGTELEERGSRAIFTNLFALILFLSLF